jgi:hypothetical protein
MSTFSEGDRGADHAPREAHRFDEEIDAVAADLELPRTVASPVAVAEEQPLEVRHLQDAEDPHAQAQVDEAVAPGVGVVAVLAQLAVDLAVLR